MNNQKVLIVALAALASGCSGLLDVDLPGVVEAKTLDDPGLSALLVESAIADFECAYTNYAAGSSAMSDEWWHTSGGQVYREWGGRQINAQHNNYVRAGCDEGGFGQYVVIHTARFQAKDAFERITRVRRCRCSRRQERPAGHRVRLRGLRPAHAGRELLRDGS